MIYSLPQTGFLRLPQVLELIPVSRSAWWSGVQSGRYPQSVKLGPRTTAWRAEDVRELIEKIERVTPDRASNSFGRR